MDDKERQSLVIREDVYGAFFSAPIPAPETLEKYKAADPSFPERIMRMAEAHNEADVKGKNRISLSNAATPIIAQF